MPQRRPLLPVVEGPWTPLCRMPDLGELAGPDPARQHIVDHSLIRDANGDWRLWACLRGAAVGRLLYGWRGGSDLLAGAFEPVGVAARAERRYGERVGEDGVEAIGAPFFLRHEDRWLCFYHSGGIRVMTSRDGIAYQRAADWGPDGNLSGIPGGRDVMVLERDGRYFSYATVTEDKTRSYVISAVSEDLKRWKSKRIACEPRPEANTAVASESPFVAHLDGYYYLWRASSTDFQTYVYRSEDPQDFGVRHDDKLIGVVPVKAPEILRVDGQWLITDLHDFQGIRIAPLSWKEA